MSLYSDFVYSRLFFKKGLNRKFSVFISGADRIGTSWCALNLSYELSLSKQKILFVDGTGNFSNAKSNIILNNPKYLEDYVNGKQTLYQLLNKYKNPYFNLLFGESGNNYIGELPLGRINIFTDDLNILSENFNHSIIDLGSGITEKKLPFCQIADNILIMCSENNEDLIKTFELIKYLNEFYLDANYYLIINKVNSFEDGYKIYEKLSKAARRNNLKYPDLLGIVRFDTRIRDTIRNKELLSSRYSGSEAAVDIRNIAKKLLSEL